MQCCFVGNKTIVKTTKLGKPISHNGMQNVKCSTKNNINNKDVLEMFTKTSSFTVMYLSNSWS